MIAKALLVALVVIVATHPPLAAFVFGVLSLGVSHLVAVAVVGELAGIAALGWLIARAVARGRGPRRLALS